MATTETKPNSLVPGKLYRVLRDYRLDRQEFYFFATNGKGKRILGGPVCLVTIKDDQSECIFLYLGMVNGMPGDSRSEYHIVIWQDMVGAINAKTHLVEVKGV